MLDEEERQEPVRLQGARCRRRGQRDRATGGDDAGRRARQRSGRRLGAGRRGGGVRRQDPMRAASGGLNRSKMAAPNQGAEDRSVSAERETSAAVPGAAPTVFLAIELSKASW